ncbi:MAG: hypothetical protein M1609_13625 [Firmicutes bacterium]|nr:hypothetical protein [Bacillota bacterium]
MFKEVQMFLEALHSDQKGSYFVEMALVVIGVALTVFAAAQGLANNGITPTYNRISTEIGNATVPNIP